MIDLHYSTTSNGLKVKLFLEVAGIPYRPVLMSLNRGDQFKPEFSALSPNNRIPAIVDHDPPGGGAALSMFESGAIMLYLAEKTDRLLPTDVRRRGDVLQWLFWQMSALGPMAGQAGYFRVYAPQVVPFAIERYTQEVTRLYGVLNKRLADREFIAGELSIADIACYPWIVPHVGHGQQLEAFPHLARWFAAIGARPATMRTYDGVEDVYARRGAPVAVGPS
jgi:GST-like protein